MSKSNVHTTQDLGLSAEYHASTSLPARYQGSPEDRHDMAVLGKEQVLRRNFSLFSMLGFASLAVMSWEIMPVFLIFSLIDGGPPAVFWGNVVGAIGFAFVYASLAEMASMCPTTGGQYHYVSEFAPPGLQKSLSYAVGWTIAIGWQTYLAGSSFMAGSIVQGLIALNVEGYEFHRWHGTLLTIAAVFFAVVINVVLAKGLPYLQYGALALHFVGLFAIVIPLWATAEHGNAREVLLDFQDNGGWGNTGLSAMIGMVAPAMILSGYDCIAHMRCVTYRY